jgi:hypothetical protein
MRQKTKNDGNQGLNAKNVFFIYFPSPLPRWVRLVPKTRAKNSHAWAEKSHDLKNQRIWHVALLEYMFQGPCAPLDPANYKPRFYYNSTTGKKNSNITYCTVCVTL